MKYYRYELMERFGEYEVTENHVIALDDHCDLDAKANDIAMENRGSEQSDFSVDLDGYWFDCNLTLIPAFYEITKQQYDLVLLSKKILTGSGDTGGSISINIKTDNAAFDEYDFEVVRILNVLLSKDDFEGAEFNLFDINGNAVGEFKSYKE